MAEFEPELERDYHDFRDPQKGTERILQRLGLYEANPWLYTQELNRFSKEGDSALSQPDQGLLLTPYDFLNIKSQVILPTEKVIDTLRVRTYLLSLSNHPYRIGFLREMQNHEFNAPQKVECRAIGRAEETGLSLSVGDLGASVIGADRERQSRTQRYAEGPFVKLGKYARMIFTGSGSPDVWNTSEAISIMAASHCLATIPRNGVMTDVKRQAKLAEDSFKKLKELRDLILDIRPDADEIQGFWKNNIGAVLEPDPETAIRRACHLFNAGIRTFRIYSPEPGMNIVKTVKSLRNIWGAEIEIFAGQIVDVDQAKSVEEAGADGIFVGIGGGGRCITGERSGSVIDWPILVWKLRGEINIPVVVEGGASDHIATTLLLGASGVSTSRVVAGGTIESPGGILYCSDNEGNLFKPYGGEASARTKFIEGKVLPFGIPSFVEGETTKAYIDYQKHKLPTLALNLHLLNEDAILAMIFRNVSSVNALHTIDPSPLKQATTFDSIQGRTH